MKRLYLRISDKYKYKNRPQDLDSYFIVLAKDLIPILPYDKCVVHIRVYNIEMKIPDCLKKEFNKGIDFKPLSIQTLSIREDFIENDIELIGCESNKEDLSFPTHNQWRKTFSWMECDIATAINMLEQNLQNLVPILNKETKERMLISSKPNPDIAKYCRGLQSEYNPYR